MNASAPHDQLLPQPPGGLWRGAALALLAHAALLAALTTAVRWRASPPEAVQAELWSAVPQAAAPAVAPAPPPPPPSPPTRADTARPTPAPPPVKLEPARPDPQIAIAQARAEKERKAREQAEREKAERERAERDKLAKEKAAKDKAEREKAEREKVERQKAEREKAETAKREAAERTRKAEEDQRRRNLERMMGQVGSGAAGPSTGSAAASGGPSASYTGKIIGAIKPNIVFTELVSGNPAAEVEVRAGPSGTILSRRLVRSSGNKEWDDAVLRAIDRTGTLPRDVDGRVPSVLTLVFRPQE